MEMQQELECFIRNDHWIFVAVHARETKKHIYIYIYIYIYIMNINLQLKIKKAKKGIHQASRGTWGCLGQT